MAWSPSSTEKFLSCPMRWWLDRQGAIGRVRDESAMEQGTEFHNAMAALWEEDGNFYWPNRVIEQAVERVIEQELVTLREQGVVCVECVLGGTEDERLCHGRYPGTCDLVTENEHVSENGTRGLTVTDYKTKMTLQPAYVDAELRQTQRSWQFKQYAWFVQEKYQRPVTHVRKLLVAFKPSLKVWLVSYPVTQEELNTWWLQANQVWAAMDLLETQEKQWIWQNSDACERYGWQHRCDHYEQCWDGAPIEYKGADDGIHTTN